MRMRRARPEQAVQKALFQHIEARGVSGLFAFHVPNGGKRNPIEAAILKGQGVRAGVPDLMLVHGGTLYCLELKADGGKSTPVQREVQDKLRNAGAVVGEAAGLDAAIAWLEERRLLRGTAGRAAA